MQLLESDEDAVSALEPLHIPLMLKELSRNMNNQRRLMASILNSMQNRPDDFDKRRNPADRIKASPKGIYGQGSVRSVRSVMSEDLTEITVTEDPSLPIESVRDIALPPLKTEMSKDLSRVPFRFSLLLTDRDDVGPAAVFNSNRKLNNSDAVMANRPAKLPFLFVDELAPITPKMHNNNNNNNADGVTFVVPIDNILMGNGNNRRPFVPLTLSDSFESTGEQNSTTIRNAAEKSPTISISSRLLQIGNNMDLHQKNSEIDEVLQPTIEEEEYSISDAVVHDGYIITPDAIERDPTFREIKNRIEREILKGNAEMITKSPQLSPKRDVKWKSDFPSDQKSDGLQPAVPKTNVYVRALAESATPAAALDQLKSYPVLSPDILGHLTLNDKKNFKNFLSIKSVDEQAWSVMDDDFHEMSLPSDRPPPQPPSHVIASAHSTPQKKPTDYFINYSNKPTIPDVIVKDDIFHSLREMDKKILSIERVSSMLERDFNESKKMLRNMDKSELLSQKHRDRHSPASQPLVLVDDDDRHQQLDNVDGDYQSTLSIASQRDSSRKSYCHSLPVEDGPSTSRSIPRLDLSGGLDDGSCYYSPTRSQRTLSLQQKLSSYRHNSNSADRIMRPNTTKSRSNIFSFNRVKRREQERKHNVIRKKEAKYMVSQIVKENTLPVQRSTKVPIKQMTKTRPVVRTKPPKSSRLEPLQEMTNEYAESLNDDYKPVRMSSYLTKVRLQRPEITRQRHKPGTPMNYSQQLQNLQPNQKATNTQRQKQRYYKRSPSSTILRDGDSNSVISDWSMPNNVRGILYSETSDGNSFADDVSQVPSVSSASVIDWDQVSEMLRSPAFK